MQTESTIIYKKPTVQPALLKHFESAAAWTDEV
jgi:hypothetical protein